MILASARKVVTSDPEAFAWANLRKYQNVEFVEQVILSLHHLEKRQQRNARKQARQLRYCLIQAREYFSAANSVTLATKPTLQYYGIMCLALAEILLKQTGDSSLDRARQQHRHHGLLFRELQAAGGANLNASAAALVAAPHINAAHDRVGTFELWHRSSREMPAVGVFRQQWEKNVVTSNCAVIAGASDERPKPLPEAGISLWECVRSLPGMDQYLEATGLQPLTLRARIEAQQWPPPNGHRVLTITLHPSNLTPTFLENFILDPAWVDRTNVRGTPGGGGAIIDIITDPIKWKPASLCYT
jgi:hypothetical protein